MAYQPSVSDIPNSESLSFNAGEYRPSLSDISNTQSQPDSDTVQTFLGNFSKKSQPIEQQIDQFNQALKTFGSVSLPFVAPEIGAVPIVSNLLSKIPMATSIGNSLGRIGYGTALSTIPDVLSEEGRKDLSGNLEHNLGLNALIEGVSYPFRGASKLAELMNPVNLANKKAEQIRNEYQIALDNEKKAYAPVISKYGDVSVVPKIDQPPMLVNKTSSIVDKGGNPFSSQSLVKQKPKVMNPEDYLNLDKEDVNYFTPNVKKSYNRFLDDPSFENLHKLQSRMGNDWAKVKVDPSKIDTAQALSNARLDVKDKIQSFLSKDKNALNQYNDALDITKNQVKPYESNALLRKISKGNIEDVTPNQLTKAIAKGTQKEVGAIPSDHPLIGHMNDLVNALQIGRAAQVGIPVLGGAMAGEYISPGWGGALSGAATGLGARHLAGIATKFGAPDITELAQNPKIINAMKNIVSPAYYGLSRSAGNYFSQRNQ